MARIKTNKVHIGLFEAVGFMSTIMISKVFYTSVMMIIKKTATASWLVTIVSCITSIIMFLLVYLLLKRFPGKNLNDVFEGTIGKIPGGILNIVFALYLLYYAGMNLREFVEIIKAISLPGTSTSIIVSAFVFVVMFMAYKGLEPIVRLAYAFFYVLIAGVLLILVLAYPYYVVDYIFPIAGNGVGLSIMTGAMRSSAYDEVILLAFVANSIGGFKNFKKAGIYAIIITGTVFSVCLLCVIMAFGYSIAGENVSNLYMLSRIIYFSRFFQRIDAIFIFIWVISSVISVGTAFYFMLDLYSKSFRIKDYKPLIIPFAVLLFTIVMIPRDLSEMIDLHMVIIKQYSFLLLFGAPVLLLVISWLFKRRGTDNEPEKV